MISCLLASITIILIYIAIRMTDFKKIFKRSGKKNQIEKFEIRKERLFFQKYANVNSKFRTVTITQAIIQGFEILNNIASISSQSLASQESNTKKLTREARSSLLNVIQSECDPGDITLKELQAANAEYEADLNEILGFGNLNKLCKCPGGEGFCDWTPEMFTRFIVRRDLWNLTSIQIFNAKTNALISTWSINNIEYSGTRTNALVVMSNQDDLEKLAAGAMVKIIFKWLAIEDGKEVERCIIIMNKIPESDNTNTGITTLNPVDILSENNSRVVNS